MRRVIILSIMLFTFLLLGLYRLTIYISAFTITASSRIAIDEEPKV